jgi:SOS-response transcriptional repressor LexA
MAEAIGDSPADWLRAAGYEEEPRPEPQPPAEAFQIEGTAGAYVPRPSDAYLPVLGTLKGGVVVEVEEDNGAEVFPCLAEHASQADYVVRITGDSMWPSLIEGDFIAVKKTSTANVGELVVAKIDDSTYVKKLAKLSRSKMTLASINPLYAPIETDKGHIVGKVVWLHRSAASLGDIGS